MLSRAVRYRQRVASNPSFVVPAPVGTGGRYGRSQLPEVVARLWPADVKDPLIICVEVETSQVAHPGAPRLTLPSNPPKQAGFTYFDVQNPHRDERGAPPLCVVFHGLLRHVAMRRK